jgi:hypothetical protein
MTEAEKAFAVLADWPICRRCHERFKPYDLKPASECYEYWRSCRKDFCPGCLRLSVLSNWNPTKERARLVAYLQKLAK